MTAPTREQIARLIDDRTEVEWLARSISLSLRSMDISIEQIAEFYYEQLVNLMVAGLIADTQNQTLFAHVHTFFLHLGAARDYLAALIAARIRKNPSKIDSMANLTKVLEPKDVETDALLKLLENRKFIQPTPSNMNRLEISGWLKEATTLRNKFVHRRPYGARHAEGFEMGLYRYVRPVLVENDAEQDILDLVVSHYRE